MQPNNKKIAHKNILITKGILLLACNFCSRHAMNYSKQLFRK